MVRYCCHVDKRSRAEMTAFLDSHFRYDTMNAWNASTSYACNMKIHNLGLDSEIDDKLYNLLEIDDFHDAMEQLRWEFAKGHNFLWQAAMNGRSGGYLVLYQGGQKPSEYKSHCTACGQRNYKSVEENGNTCGKCRRPSRKNYPKPPIQVFSYPGKSTDMGEDFDGWTMDELRDRVELVQSFDRLADDMLAEALWIASNYDVQEETVLVPHRSMVLVPCASGKEMLL